MVVKWSSVLLMVVMGVCVITRAGCLIEHPLQSLDADTSSFGNTEQPPPLREFYDHAELKALPTEEKESEDLPSTTTESIPSPVSVKRKNSEYEDLNTEKKLSVPKKGVPSLKSSVVPKKEVHFAPSVVAKKGADPESSTPSVSPRKGVQLPPQQGTRVEDLLLVSSENMNNTSAYVSDSKPGLTAGINAINDKLTDKKALPVPKLIKSGKNSSSVPNTTPVPVSTLPAPESSTVAKIVHYKPATADDIGKVTRQISYAPIFMIVALILLVVVVVAVGYHRLKDIWARRHYNYVDFLIDGMYE